MRQLTMSVTLLKGYSVLKVHGPIRKSDSAAFGRALAHLVRFSSLPVAVDLRDAERIHPKAIAEMLDVLKTSFPARLVDILISGRGLDPESAGAPGTGEPGELRRFRL